jgi:hypothetical protein
MEAPFEGGGFCFPCTAQSGAEKANAFLAGSRRLAFRAVKGAVCVIAEVRTSHHLAGFRSNPALAKVGSVCVVLLRDFFDP